MADVRPFKGVLYNKERIKDLSDVVTPPYDVISPKEQAAFHARHPRNIIRLILGKKRPEDAPASSSHTRAAAHLNQWMAEGALIRDPAPALYFTSVDFVWRNQSIRRWGVIALVRLEPFENGVVLPHEKTFSKVRSEQLELMKACHANFGPIFSLFSDREGIIPRLTDHVDGRPPESAFTDDKGHVQKLWRIADPDVHAAVNSAMRDKIIFIADGHHRYETALNYKAWLRENNPDMTEEHPANYVMMYLSSMEDPGLTILPAHRILKDVPADRLDALVNRSEDVFETKAMPFNGADPRRVRDEFIRELKANARRNAFGLYVKGRPEYRLFFLKPGVMERRFGDDITPSLRDLDVTVLTRLIFMDILGFDQARLDNETLITYASLAEDAIDIVNDSDFDVTFLLNPTRIAQVRRVAEQALIMPRKSTYFYPKVLTGQVIYSLRPETA